MAWNRKVAVKVENSGWNKEIFLTFDGQGLDTHQVIMGR